MGEEGKNSKNISKTNKLETRLFKLHQEILEDKEKEHKLKEEEKTEDQQQLKEDDTENKKIKQVANRKNKNK